MAERWEPTEKQLRDLHVTLRHLGRALASFSRVDIPGGDSDPVRWHLYSSGRALNEASDRLIDALEAMDDA